MIFSEKRLCIFYLEFFLYIVCASSQGCEKKLKCGICLQQPGCIWCVNPIQKTSPNDQDATPSHCMKDTADVKCLPVDLINSTTTGKSIQDLEFKTETGNFVQLKPQKISLDLRIGQSYDLHFQYRQAENYPVDLYYIIDNSYSMIQYRKTLANLGTELIKRMRGITNDLTIGFGSFVDKVVEPYVSTEPKKLKFPCDANDCITPYSFKNHMRLSKHFEEFSRLLKETKPSTNLDNPEGGFDAIMQAIVCKEQIGWRPQARHLIVFSTDAEFHIAGDGKLGGIIKTNDAKCHMVNNDYNGLFNDYPSVSHLNYIANENNINLIFALPKNRPNEAESYRLLSKQIKNSKMDNTTSTDDSKNVIDLVVSNYRRIIGSITLGHNASENIRVQIKPHCQYIKRDGCKRVKLGEVVNFTASFELLKCNDNLNKPITISLKPDAINESLIVEVVPRCECDCEFPKYHNKSAVGCSKGQGDLVCGVCSCHKGRFGRNCECDNEYNMTIASKKCKEHNDAKECSGVGTCLCGMCHCNRNPYTLKEYSGRYCECDNDSCEKEDDKLCGGRGTCDCGKCICNAGWTGRSCNCPEDKKTCIQDGHTEVCSGNGTCYCGKCQCEKDFTGTYCEICPTCDALCPVMLDCVLCTVFGNGKYNREDCKLKCIEYNITSVNGDIVDQKKENERICRGTVKKCEIIYKYSKDDLDNLVITVSKEQNCEPNLFVWVLSVIASVILLGLLTLIIWKIITTFHDRNEYQKFCKEQKQSKWHRNDNPLYKNATTTFENPYYPH